MATAQLQLITKGSSWKLDRRTIAIGKAGIAAARAVLAESEPEFEFGLTAVSIAGPVPAADLANQTTPIRTRARRQRRQKPVPAGQVSLLPILSESLDTAA